MLAVGPLAVLPSPVLAALPATQPFTVTSGTATWTVSGTTGAGTANITASNRAVLVWGFQNSTATQVPGTFNIGTGETFNFNVPNGAVLNKIGYNPNGTLATADTATISGNLVSNGSVFILANGNIVVNSGAVLNTATGLVLSTLAETSDFAFTTSNPASLSYSGNATGNITLGSSATAVQVIGSLAAYAGNVAVNNLTVNGDLVVNTRNATTPFSPTTGLNVSGNASVTTNNSAIGGAGAIWIVGNTATLNTTGNQAVTLNNVANDFGSIIVTTNGTDGTVNISDLNQIVLGASSIGGDLVVTSLGGGNVGGNRSITTNGAVAVAGNATFIQNATGNSSIVIADGSSVGGNLSASSTSNSSFTFNGVGNITVGTAGGVTGITTVPTGAVSGTNGRGTGVTIITNGTVTVNSAITATGNNGGGGGAISLTGNTITINAPLVSNNATSNITLNATGSGGITLNNTTTSARGGVNMRTANATLTQTPGSIISTGNTTGTSVFNAGSGTVSLLEANSLAAGSIVQVTAGTATINASGNTAAGQLQLGTSNVTGNLTLVRNGANGIQIGSGLGTAAQALTIGGVLTVNTTAGNITDENYGVQNIAGGLNLNTTGGNITLDAASANGGLAPLVQFGAVSANTNNAGTVSIVETSTLNVGTINATSLTVASVSGGIVQSGNITTSVSTTANVGTNGTINLNGSNNFGTIVLNGGTDAVANSAAATVTARAGVGATAPTNVTFTSTNGGSIVLGATSTAGNITVNSAGAIDVAGTVSAGNLNLMAASTSTTAGTEAIEQGMGGVLAVSGVTTIASGGAVALTSANDFGTVTLNQAASLGNVAVSDINHLTLNGTAGGNVTAIAGAAGGIAAAWNLTLGNIVVGSLTAQSSDGGGGNSGSVSQAAGTRLHTDGLLNVITDGGNIVLGNNGNNAGRVQFSTNQTVGMNGTGTVTYVEDGSIRVGNIATNSNVTLRSNFGSIIEDTNAATGFNVRATLNATAANGSILLGGTTNNNTTSGNVANFQASAPTGAVAIRGTGDFVNLRDINANSLTVNASGNITQSSPIRVFGSSSFTAGRNITLTNNSNNFGPVSLNVTGTNNNIAITENSTLNLRSVTMVGSGNGTFTATSLNGDIIDTGLGGVVLGGNSTSAGSGVVTLAASNGNITLDDPTSNFASTSGIVFNGRDVTLSVLGSNTSALILGATGVPSAATGNLTVTTALGSIANAGSFTAGGTAFFQAPNGSIVINQPGVGFGQLRFVGQQVSIAEAGNMDILTGSSSFGPAALTSGGNISIVNVGGLVTFGNTVNLTATGNITLPKLVQAAGQMRVRHTGTANLSALSIAGDLGNIAPIDEGTGPYVAPQP